MSPISEYSEERSFDKKSQATISQYSAKEIDNETKTRQDKNSTILIEDNRPEGQH